MVVSVPSWAYRPLGRVRSLVTEVRPASPRNGGPPGPSFVAAGVAGLRLTPAHQVLRRVGGDPGQGCSGNRVATAATFTGAVAAAEQSPQSAATTAANQPAEPAGTTGRSEQLAGQTRVLLMHAGGHLGEALRVVGGPVVAAVVTGAVGVLVQQLAELATLVGVHPLERAAGRLAVSVLVDVAGDLVVAAADLVVVIATCGWPRSYRSAKSS